MSACASKELYQISFAISYYLIVHLSQQVSRSQHDIFVWFKTDFKGSKPHHGLP